MVKTKNDIMAGIILLAYSLFHIFYLTPDQVELHQNDTLLALSPRLFCYITAGLLAGLSALLLGLSLKRRANAGGGKVEADSWQPLMRGLFCTAMACAYVLLAGALGFFSGSAVAMVVFLIYFGVRNWAGILLFLVIVLGFIYLLFVELLQVVMPDGLLF